MSKIIDLTGKRFGRLVVIYRDGKCVPVKWVCKCDCGKTKSIHKSALLAGLTKSCGCYNSEVARNTMTSHGHSDERLYSIWLGLKGRCNNRNNHKYQRYGGRGISVCDEWYDYSVFRSWSLENGYEESLQIDRVDNDGDYSPSNCRFVPLVDNIRNSTVAKLTVEDVAEIKLRIEQKENRESIASDFSVKRCTIDDIAGRRTWKDVEPLVIPHG